MKRAMINVSLQRYGTRMLKAGDEFEANPRDARVLAALKKAKFPEGGEAPAAAPHSHGHAQGGGDISLLRSQYQSKFGKKPFHGWSADDLKAKLAADVAED